MVACASVFHVCLWFVLFILLGFWLVGLSHPLAYKDIVLQELVVAYGMSLSNWKATQAFVHFVVWCCLGDWVDISGARPLAKPEGQNLTNLTRPTRLGMHTLSVTEKNLLNLNFGWRSRLPVCQVLLLQPGV